MAANAKASQGRVLIVDDEEALVRAFWRYLSNSGYVVDTATDGETAAAMVQQANYDVIVTDIAMPGMDGLELLRQIRARNADVPVIIITATPAVDTAVQALEHGALRYLVKPFEVKVLEQAVRHAVQLHRMAKLKREALDYLRSTGRGLDDRAGLEAGFGRALDTLWMAYQPIVSWERREVYAYEALLRSDEPSLPHPGAVLDAAERLGRLYDVGRAVRSRAASDLPGSPTATVFVNIHTNDLMDESLYEPDSPLTRNARSIVLEVTERGALDGITDLRARVARLRQLGFRIAVDDLGAGYAGLASFAQLEPEVVKLDMSLVRNVNTEPTRRKLVQSMVSLCKEMGLLVIAEGVETAAERDTLADLGCDLLQGYLFGRPARGFPSASW